MLKQVPVSQENSNLDPQGPVATGNLDLQVRVFAGIPSLFLVGMLNLYHNNSDFQPSHAGPLKLSWSMLGHILSEEQSKDGSNGVSDDGRLTCYDFDRFSLYRLDQ